MNPLDLAVLGLMIYSARVLPAPVATLLGFAFGGMMLFLGLRS